MIEGTYLKQDKIVQHGIHFVDYQRDNKVLQYIHLVVATGLCLHPVKLKCVRHNWRLDSKDHEKILQVYIIVEMTFEIYFIII